MDNGTTLVNISESNAGGNAGGKGWGNTGKNGGPLPIAGQGTTWVDIWGNKWGEVENL